MNEKQTQLISVVINTLDQIQVPSRYTDTISAPVYNCSNALRQMLMEDQQEKQMKKADEQKIEIGEPVMMSEEEVQEMLAQSEQDYGSSESSTSSESNQNGKV